MDMRDVDVRELFGRAVASWCDRVAAVPDGAWGQPTPCARWDVRTLVHHLVEEHRWVQPLAAGSTIEEVGDRFAGDLLGADPAAACTDAAREATDALAGVALDSQVHLSFGDTALEEYVWQLTADALVHTWDLARATGQPESLDPDVVAACGHWFATQEPLYRAAGVIGPAVPVDPGADATTALIGRFGRDPAPAATLAVIVRFNAAFGHHDLAALADLVTPDCVFEDTTPPDGTRHQGRDAVLAAFGEVFAASPSAVFVTEHGVECGDRLVQQWRYDWAEDGGGHIRGIDLFTVRDGQVAAKLSYVKG